MSLPSVVQIEGCRADDDGDVLFTDYAVAVPRVGDRIWLPPSARDDDQNDFWIVKMVDWEFGRRQQEEFQRVTIWLHPVVGLHKSQTD